MSNIFCNIWNKIVRVVGVDNLMILLPSFIFYPLMALAGIEAMKYKQSEQIYSMDGDV
jgi:hypothetical protein